MIAAENESKYEKTPDFDFGMSDFDINAAMQGAVSDVITDEQLATDEKIKRMENIVGEGSSEVYREFVDFRALAAQVKMFCNHDHSLNQSVQNSDILSGFMGAHVDKHDHSSSPKNKKEDDEYEIDPKTGKKRKKKRKLLNW